MLDLSAVRRPAQASLHPRSRLSLYSLDLQNLPVCRAESVAVNSLPLREKSRRSARFVLAFLCARRDERSAKNTHLPAFSLSCRGASLWAAFLLHRADLFLISFTDS